MSHFRTLPPIEAAYRAAQLDRALSEHFARRAAAQPRPATCCSKCAFPIAVRERVALAADGAVYHAGCR